MQPKNFYSIEDAINHFMKMFYNISGGEFRQLFPIALKETDPFSFNQQGAEAMADHLWEKWNSLHRNPMAFWSALDDNNRKAIAFMAQLYAENKNPFTGDYNLRKD